MVMVVVNEFLVTPLIFCGDYDGGGGSDAVRVNIDC